MYRSCEVCGNTSTNTKFFEIPNLEILDSDRNEKPFILNNILLCLKCKNKLLRFFPQRENEY